MADERTLLLGQRDSLLARMRNVAKATPGVQPARRVQLTLAMDRLLARLLATTPWGTWVLKGGYANQLRSPKEARFTQDVDLRIDESLDQAHGILATAVATDLSDLLSHELLGEPRPLEGPPGGGLRFLVRANLAGFQFVTFGVDVNAKDAVVGSLERHPSDPSVAMLGFPVSIYPTYPVAQQFAEKIHAFTRPRLQPNTRVKDLADMVWYTERYGFESRALLDSCLATFGQRQEHSWPTAIPHAPPEWARPYATLRAELDISPVDPDRAREAIVAFLEPIFDGQAGRRWDPDSRSWSR